MVLVLGFLQFFIIALISVFEFKNKSSVVFLWATLLVMFGIMHMGVSFWGDRVYSDEVLMEASVFVISFCCLYIFIRLLYKRQLSINKHNFQCQYIYESLLRQNNYDRFFFAVFLIALFFKIFPFIQNAGSIFLTSWASARAYSTSLDYVNSGQLARVCMYSFSGVIALYYIKNDKRWIICSILLVLQVLLTRNRIEILPLICSLASVYIFKNKTIRLKTILAVFLSGVFIVCIVYSLVIFRHYGNIQTFVENFELSDFAFRLQSYLADERGEIGLRKVFYFFLQNDNQFQNFGKMHTYLRMFLVYIPTNWSFGLKPNDFAIAMGHAIGMVEGGSTHPTLFGDCYANLGSFGVLLGIYWALYANLIDYITLKRKNTTIQILMFVLNAVVYVVIGRGSVYNGFWYAAYGIPLLVFIGWLFNNVKLPNYKYVIKLHSK